VIADFARLDLLKDQGLDGFFDALSVAEIGDRFDHPFSLQLFGADPSFAGIPIVTECIEEALRPGWRGVE
jgi:hypothetical protein